MSSQRSTAPRDTDDLATVRRIVLDSLADHAARILADIDGYAQLLGRWVEGMELRSQD